MCLSRGKVSVRQYPHFLICGAEGGTLVTRTIMTRGSFSPLLMKGGFALQINRLLYARFRRYIMKEERVMIVRLVLSNDSNCFVLSLGHKYPYERLRTPYERFLTISYGLLKAAVRESSVRRPFVSSQPGRWSCPRFLRTPYENPSSQGGRTNAL